MKFIYVKEKKLYTPVINYQRKDSSITAIGTIHIGLPEYYSALQREIDRHSHGFFEGIRKAGEKKPTSERREALKNLRKLPKVYKVIAEMSGLVCQKGNLDYRKWENSDIDEVELIESLSERMIKRISRLTSVHDGCGGIKSKKERRIMGELIKRCALVVYGSTIIPKLIDPFWERSAGNDVVIDRRNRVVCTSIEERIKEGVKEMGVIYGAGHLEGIERYLLDQKFKREGEYWVNAWRLNPEISSITTFMLEGLKRI